MQILSNPIFALNVCKSGLGNTMVTSDFRPEVEIWPFRACAMRNTQYNPYLWPNCRNFRVLQEIRIEEHDGDVRFYTRSGNMAVSCMRNASGHNCRNSSFIVDVVMGQIPRSTERISSEICFAPYNRVMSFQFLAAKFCSHEFRP